jgi:hypothetical protein
VTFLSQLTSMAAITGRIKQAVVWTTLKTDIFQYQQSRIRQGLK